MIANELPDYRKPLDPQDAEAFGPRAAAQVEHFLQHRENHKPTPLYPLPALAHALDVGSIHIKDESHRLDAGSFKALGGSYAVMRLVLETASAQLGKTVDIGALHAPPVRDITRQLTIGCATTGNHGVAVAAAANLVGAKAVVFVHANASKGRVAAIERWGARIVHVDGVYEDAAAEASRVCAHAGWLFVSDMSRAGDERVATMLMQGYTPIVGEALRSLAEPPTHVFVQAGIGALAGAAAAYLSVALGSGRPTFVVVEPERAASLLESIRDGRVRRYSRPTSTIMSMLECYEPSRVAWRILSRQADFFMTVRDEDAMTVMNQLARPSGADPAIVSGESGGVGLAGLMRVAQDSDLRADIGLGSKSRVLVINTEGANDLLRYSQIVGLSPIIVCAGLPCEGV